MTCAIEATGVLCGGFRFQGVSAVAALIGLLSGVTCSTESQSSGPSSAASDPTRHARPDVSVSELLPGTPRPVPAEATSSTLGPPRQRASSTGSVVPDESLQVVVVTTPTWNSSAGKVVRLERDSARSSWHRVGGEEDVVIGKHGMAWGRGLHPPMSDGPSKVEGDQRAPAGVFDLGEARGYAPALPNGATWPYHRLTEGWRCVDDPRAGEYNAFLGSRGNYAIVPAIAWDGVRRDRVFEYLVVVKHNMAPIERGAGSCVFLHVWQLPGLPTKGCTGMARSALHDLVAWLAPSSRPVLVQLPKEVLVNVRQSWGIPE